MRVGCLEDRRELRNPRPNFWTREMMLAARNKPKVSPSSTGSGAVVTNNNILTDGEKTKVTDFLNRYITAIGKKQYTDLQQNYWCSVAEKDIRDVCIRTNTTRTPEQIWSNCAAYAIDGVNILEIKKVGGGVLVTIEFKNIFLMNEVSPIKRMIYLLPKGNSYCTNNWYFFQWDLLRRSVR